MHLTIDKHPNLLLWVMALESGEFHQTKARLTKGRNTSRGHAEPDFVITGHCCMGVACEVALTKGVEINVGWEKDEGFPVFYNKTYDSEYQWMPLRVARWLGYDEPMYEQVVHCYIRTPNGDHNLTTLNDSDRKRFRTIARLIREHGLHIEG